MNDNLANKLTNKKLLFKNILWNFFAQGFPLIIALVTIPLIIKGMGTDRFSILTLVWTVLGYSNLFDFGLGRALTQLISKKIGNNDTKDIPSIIWTTLFIVFFLGLFALAVVWVLTPLIAINLLKIPGIYINETINSLYLVAISLPSVLLIINIKGILESYQNFALLSFLKIPVIIFNYIGPLFVLPFTNNLYYVVLLLVIGKIITFFLHAIACIKTVEGLTGHFNINKAYIKPLISFGGWITVSNTIGPMMHSLDRFFLAGIISVTKLAYYITPFDILNRLSIIPAAIIGVMFPTFSTEFQRDKVRTKKLYYQTIKYIALLLLVPVLLIIIFAKAGLSFWLTSEFAEQSYRITQVIALGFFIDGINQAPIALIQGSGRSNVTGIILLCELPFFLGLLYLFINWYGLIGAPLAWLCKTTIDLFVLNFWVYKFMKVNPS